MEWNQFWGWASQQVYVTRDQWTRTLTRIMTTEISTIISGHVCFGNFITDFTIFENRDIFFFFFFFFFFLFLIIIVSSFFFYMFCVL